MINVWYVFVSFGISQHIVKQTSGENDDEAIEMINNNNTNNQINEMISLFHL